MEYILGNRLKSFIDNTFYVANPPLLTILDGSVRRAIIINGYTISLSTPPPRDFLLTIADGGNNYPLSIEGSLLTLRS
jgi:hypothetical protein